MVIVAAVDRSDKASNVVAQAERLAKAFEDDVHAVHVLSRSDFVDLERTNVDKTGTALNMDEVRAAAKEIAAGAVADVDVPVESVGLVGEPADRIVDYADEHNAQYIVVSGRKRSPAGKAIFGSVAQSILLNANHPVVVSLEE